MKNNKLKQVFSFILLSLFAISLPISIYVLKTGNLDLRISAFESEEPVRVMVTDRTSNSLKVLWLTEKKVFGAIKIVETGDVISENFESNSHFLELNDLEPNTSYSIVIYSGTTEFPQSLPIKTLSYSDVVSNNYLVFGQVFDKSGIKVQDSGIITMQAFDGDLKSELIASTINETGGYQLNLKNLYQFGTGYKFSYNKNIDVELAVYTGPVQEPVIKKYTFNLSTQRQIPNIYLGDINLDIIPGIEGN
jgi:hypothetical protein